MHSAPVVPPNHSASPNSGSTQEPVLPIEATVYERAVMVSCVVFPILGIVAGVFALLAGLSPFWLAATVLTPFAVPVVLLAGEAMHTLALMAHSLFKSIQNPAAPQPKIPGIGLGRYVLVGIVGFAALCAPFLAAAADSGRLWKAH